MANFDAFHLVISSSIKLLFLKSVHAQHHLWAKELYVAKEGGKDHQIEMIGM